MTASLLMDTDVDDSRPPSAATGEQQQQQQQHPGTNTQSEEDATPESMRPGTTTTGLLSAWTDDSDAYYAERAEEQQSLMQAKGRGDGLPELAGDQRPERRPVLLFIARPEANGAAEDLEDTSVASSAGERNNPFSGLYV